MCTGKGHYAGRVMTQPGGSGAGRTGRGPRGAAGGAGGRPAPRRSGWSNNPANYHRFSFHAIKDFMSEANESVTYRIQEGGSYEWIVDGATKLLERYRIVRIDAGLELGYECECGRSDQRGSMPTYSCVYQRGKSST